MITAEWRSSKKQLPDEDRPVLGYLPRKSIDGTSYCLLPGRAVRSMSAHVEYWVYLEDLEPDPELIF